MAVVFNAAPHDGCGTEVILADGLGEGDRVGVEIADSDEDGDKEATTGSPERTAADNG